MSDDVTDGVSFSGSWATWRRGNDHRRHAACSDLPRAPEGLAAHGAFTDCTAVISIFSDVSVELPFTLMHPKPLEEPTFRDGELPEN